MSMYRREAMGLILAGTLHAQEVSPASSLPLARPMTSPIPLHVLRHGSIEAPPRQISLQAGPLQLLFEPDLAQIRHLRIGPVEVLRAVYGAVRDRNWNTILPRVSDLSITTTGDGFSVRFTAECRNPEVHFRWHGELDGDATGQVRFRFRGKALSSFLRNRIGLCVLHDGEKLPGRPVRVEHGDGRTTNGAFPRHISPHQPFLDIRAIAYPVVEGLEAEVRMEGDTFEMEDQRNWTDASFKTYSTPLHLPFPVEIASGTEIEQTVTFRFLGKTPPESEAAGPAYLDVHVEPAKRFRLPPIGACIASEAPPLQPQQASRLRAAGIAHLRVDLQLFDPAWRQLWTRAIQESTLLGVPLELALHVDSSAAAQLAGFAGELRRHPPKVARLMLFHRDEKSTSRASVEAARNALGPLLPKVPIGSGSNAYFTEVNRERPPIEVSDFVCWSSNPQVHAFDNLSLSETMPMYQATLESARSFCRDLPLVVSPISLKPRFNPNATATAATANADVLPESVDLRQMSLFAAGWTLGVLKYLALGRASAATLFETTGWRGWMESLQGSPLPALFPSMAGMAFPLYHVLADFADFAGGDLLFSASSSPLALESVALRKSSRLRLLLANLSNIPQTVMLPAAPLGSRVRAKSLDEFSVLEATREPEQWRRKPGALLESADGRYLLPLLPYAVVRLDQENR